MRCFTFASLVAAFSLASADRIALSAAVVRPLLPTRTSFSIAVTGSVLAAFRRSSSSRAMSLWNPSWASIEPNS